MPRNSSSVGTSRSTPWAWWSTRGVASKLSRRRVECGECGPLKPLLLRGARTHSVSVLLEVTLLLECRVSRGIGRPPGTVEGEVGLGEDVSQRAGEQGVGSKCVQCLLLGRREP